MLRRSRGIGVVLAVFAAALLLGVGSAGSAALVVTQVKVEVIGKGTVRSDSGGINCGSGKTSCFVEFSGNGTGNVTLTADPDNGWSGAQWGGPNDTDCVGDSPPTCKVPLDGTAHQVTANFKGSNAPATLSVSVPDTNPTGGKGGRVLGGGITCGTSGKDCTWTVLDGSTVTLEAIPDNGFVFTGWGGACSGQTILCTVQMNGDQSVVASFAASTSSHTLTVTISGSGTVFGAGLDCAGPAICTKDQPAGAVIELTAQPADGYIFTGWTGACTGTGFHCTLSMDDDRAVTATFAGGTPLTVNVNGNGNVSSGNGVINCGNGGQICSAGLALNTTVTLVATAGTGATFTGWTGACGGTSTSCTILMSAARDVTATFSGGVASTFPLTVTVSGNGTVTSSTGGISCSGSGGTCSANFSANVTVTLTASAGSGATFTGWGGACSGSASTCSVTMSAARSVTATFTGGSTTVALSVSVTGKGTVSGGGINCVSGSGTCAANVTANSSVQLVATAASGWNFQSWSGGCTGTAPTCTVVMSSAKSVVATFTSTTTVALTLNVRGRGSITAPGGACASSGAGRTCKQSYPPGTNTTLVATPLPGGAFLGWTGACTGKSRTCVVRLTQAKTVTASFSGVVTTGAVLESTARPTVKKTARGFSVTLHIATSRGGVLRVRALRAGRVMTALRFRVPAGADNVGPFPVALPGYYFFEATLNAAGRVHKLEWRACVGGACGRNAPASAGAFVVTRQPLEVKRAGAAWNVTLHFHETKPAGVNVEVIRGRAVVADLDFAPGAGNIALGPFVLAPGSYRFRLTAIDAFGRVRKLTFVALLAS